MMDHIDATEYDNFFSAPSQLQLMDTKDTLGLLSIG